MLSGRPLLSVWEIKIDKRHSRNVYRSAYLVEEERPELKDVVAFWVLWRDSELRLSVYGWETHVEWIYSSI